jgi:selenocysteine-specific elongation factor
MHVIGTAGHVDHGKSSLVAAITGIHPDRLKEEQEREMTIDLGFGWMDLPNGEKIGIVDVPGHRDFIENMLAGVGGIDAALFVIAADEGVMPQTREHLAILDLLQVDRGVIALTKIDLVDDEDWLDLVEEDVRSTISSSSLADAPIIRVSAKTRKGVEELKKSLAECLEDTPQRADIGRPRLPVDRVFTIAGFGTVVTGTLLDGSFKVGDEVVILPGNYRGRIRGLQTHQEKETTAIPGSRTAVNVSGVNVDQIKRGDVLAHPHQYIATQRIDTQFRMVADANNPLLHNSEVKMFVGAAEVLGRVRLIGADQIIPGETGWLQLELRDPIVTVRGDRYILRRPSPGETIGGGKVLDANPRRRYKRFTTDVLEKMKALTAGTPAEVTLQALKVVGITSLQGLRKQTRLSDDQFSIALDELFETDQILYLERATGQTNGEELISSVIHWNGVSGQAESELRKYHQTFPLKRGMPREALKSRLKMDQRTYTAAMRKWSGDSLLVEAGTLVRLPEHQITFTPAQKSQIDKLLNQFAQAGYSPPSVKDCQALVGEEVYYALLDLKILVQVTTDVVFRSEDFENITRQVKDTLVKNSTITVAQFRDMFNTSRKYALAVLEYLDEIGVTLREGDLHRLKSN